MGQNSIIVSAFEALRRVNKKTKIFLYFGVLLAITIPFWILGSVTHISGLPFDMQLNVLLVFAMPLVTLYFIARERGFASLRQVAIDCLPVRRASSLGLAVAFLSLPLAATLVFFITHFFVAFDGWSISFLLAPVYFVVYYVAAAFEEIGWTWYATPLLGKSMNVVSTGIIIGVVWATIHTLPWFQQSGLWFMVGMIVFSVFSRIIMTWLYLKNGELLWLNIMYHAMINTTFTMFYSGSPYANPIIYAVILAPFVIIQVRKYGIRSSS
jgi:uncharacterized protein